jgi:hypothetical protein
MMLETGIFESDAEDMIYVPENPPKVNLEESHIMKRIKSFL